MTWVNISVDLFNDSNILGIVHGCVTYRQLRSERIVSYLHFIPYAPYTKTY